MPLAVLIAQLEALPRLEAEQQLRAIEAASMPWTDDGTRRKVLRRYERMSAGEAPERLKSLQEAFGSLGLPVVFEPVKEAN